MPRWLILTFFLGAGVGRKAGKTKQNKKPTKQKQSKKPQKVNGPNY